MKRPDAKLYELATAIELSERERAAEVDALNQSSSLPSQVDDTSYRPSSPSTLNGGDTNNQTTHGTRRSHLQATIQIPAPRPPINADDTNYRPPSPSTLNGELAQSAIPIYRFRSATLRARTIRLAKESKPKSAQPKNKLGKGASKMTSLEFHCWHGHKGHHPGCRVCELVARSLKRTYVDKKIFSMSCDSDIVLQWTRLSFHIDPTVAENTHTRTLTRVHQATLRVSHSC